MPNLIEKLAAYAHESWAGWMRYLFSRCSTIPSGDVLIPSEMVQRWQRQLSTPYEKLPESEKESDRAEARKMLAIVIGEDE